MSDWRLRLASENDAPVIVDVMRRAFVEYATRLDPPSGVHKESVESVRSKMNTGQWVLAEDGGKVMGCVWWENRGEYAYVGRLAVPPEFRGKGIANALMDHVEARVREENVPCVRLGVRIVLEHLHGMYERRGYRIVEYHTHEGYDTPTYVTMEKTVSGNAESRKRAYY
jgi:ribosomal protein S18 acetylase RimI-like enzyme